MDQATEAGMNYSEVQIIGAVILILALVGLGIWLVTRNRSAAGTDSHRTVAEREDAFRREVESLREQNRLLTERLDRYDRSHTTDREEWLKFRETGEARLARVDTMERLNKELQEQIFEVRETQKVLMQRDDRHERTVQELQEEIGRLRTGTDHQKV